MVRIFHLIHRRGQWKQIVEGLGVLSGRQMMVHCTVPLQNNCLLRQKYNISRQWEHLPWLGLYLAVSKRMQNAAYPVAESPVAHSRLGTPLLSSRCQTGRSLSSISLSLVEHHRFCISSPSQYQNCGPHLSEPRRDQDAKYWKQRQQYHWQAPDEHSPVDQRPSHIDLEADHVHHRAWARQSKCTHTSR